MLVTQDAIISYNISHELLSLAMQLQSQVAAWKFLNCNLVCKMLDLINSVQPVITNCLIALDFSFSNFAGKNKSIFLKCVHSYTCLTKFTIHNCKNFCNVAEDTAMFLLHNTQLKELDISNVTLHEKNLAVLAQSLKNHSNLTKLNLSPSNQIDVTLDEVNINISVILSNNIKMEELDLSGIELQDFAIIANSMRNLLHLKKLNVSSTGVSAVVIADILSHNTKLEHLSLSKLSLCFEDFMTIAPKMKIHCKPKVTRYQLQ